MREWWNRFRTSIGGRRTTDEELAEEVRAHRAMQEADLRERGFSAAEARARFGNSTYIAEAARDTWSFPGLESLLYDVRYGLRGMRRAPSFSLVVILTFALGVGVNTAIFSVVNTVLLKPFPYPDCERLVRLNEANTKSGFSVSWVNFNHWRASNHSFEEMAAYQYTDRTLTGRGNAVSTRGLMVTAPYFGMLGMHPLMGRLFAQEDDRAGAASVVVLSHQFWTSQFGGDPKIVGTTLNLNGVGFEVAGVAAPIWTLGRIDYYLSLGRASAGITKRGAHGSIRAIGRLKPGVTLASARTDLDAIMRHLAETDPGPEADHHSTGIFLTEDAIGDVRGTLWVLMGAAVLILLIACANVASLLLARNTARAGELALRKAIGAGQFRVIRQLLTENVVIAAAGGIVGIGLAYWGTQLLIGFAPRTIPRLAETGLDVRVLLFSAAATLAAGLLAGMAPVLLARNVDLTMPLKESTRTAPGGRQRQSIRNALVIAEVAITFVLAFGSGILLRSLIAAQHTDPGFDSRNLVAFSISLPGKVYPTDAAANQFFASLQAGLHQLPGAIDVTAASCPPPSGDCSDWFYSVPGRAVPPRDQVPIALFNVADAGYFRSMHIAIRDGREFNDSDRGGPKVAVINEKLARQWWPNQPAVGQQIKVGGPYQEGELIQIVGVSASVRQSGLDADTMPEVMTPTSQNSAHGLTILVRTSGDPARLMGAIRGRVTAVDRNLPLIRFGLLESQLGEGLARRRFSTLLLTIFATLAMALAGIGIYGMLSYWVTSREPEIAIRLALGAKPATILQWTSLHAIRLAVAGVVLGIGGGWIGARFLEGMVFGIGARNPQTMAMAGLAVTALAFLATAIPAIRAARLDVAQRLHHG